MECCGNEEGEVEGIFGNFGGGKFLVELEGLMEERSEVEGWKWREAKREVWWE